MARTRQTARKSTGEMAPRKALAHHVMRYTLPSIVPVRNIQNINSNDKQLLSQKIGDNDGQDLNNDILLMEGQLKENYDESNKLIQDLKQNMQNQKHYWHTQITQLKQLVNEKDNQVQHMKQQYRQYIRELRHELFEIKKDHSDIGKLLKLCQLSDPNRIYNTLVDEGFTDIHKMKHINDRKLREMNIHKLNDRIEILNGIKTLLHIHYGSILDRESRSRSRSRNDRD